MSTFILIILFSYEYKVTSEQIEYKTAEACQTVAGFLNNKKYILHTYCLEKK